MKKASPYFHPQSIVESEAIGSGTRIWAFAHVMPGARIGADSNIGECCFIEGCSVLGNRVTVKNGVSLWDRVIVEDDVFIGPNAVFTNVRLPISRERGNFEETVVKKGACIGANATVVCGITIGCYAFVGAGAVVTRPVPAYALVYGNPAKVRGFLCSCRKPLTFRGKKATCPCGNQYERRSAKDVRPRTR